MKRKCSASTTMGTSQKLSATAKTPPATAAGATIRTSPRSVGRPGAASHIHKIVTPVKRKR